MHLRLMGARVCWVSGRAHEGVQGRLLTCPPRGRRGRAARAAASGDCTGGMDGRLKGRGRRLGRRGRRVRRDHLVVVRPAVAIALRVLVVVDQRNRAPQRDALLVVAAAEQAAAGLRDPGVLARLRHVGRRARALLQVAGAVHLRSCRAKAAQRVAALRARAGRERGRVQEEVHLAVIRQSRARRSAARWAAGASRARRPGSASRR